MADSDGSAWLQQLQAAKSTAMVQDGRVKSHYTFDDGREMVEEHEVSSGVLATRKWRRTGVLGSAGKWQYEVGEVPQAAAAEDAMMVASSSSPVFLRQDTLGAFAWRIRNLPYPLEIYSLTVTEENEIILRTSNKKYYKKFECEDMGRLDLNLEAEQLTMAHANNTLLISYKKPQQVLAVEGVMKRKREGMKLAEDGDIAGCAQQ